MKCHAKSTRSPKGLHSFKSCQRSKLVQLAFTRKKIRYTLFDLTSVRGGRHESAQPMQPCEPTA